jgi:hypothetical protein
MSINEILQRILIDKHNRPALIKEFQKIIWDSDEFDEFLSSLAHDLDYYEPDSEKRKVDPIFYGDERLEKEISGAIQKLNPIG